MMNMGACCEEIKMLRFNPFVHFACKQLTKKEPMCAAMTNGGDYTPDT